MEPMHTQTTSAAVPSKLIEDIAKSYFGVATLEARNRDSLDFYDVGVLQMRAALDAAYQAGLNAAKLNK